MQTTTPKPANYPCRAVDFEPSAYEENTVYGSYNQAITISHNRKYFVPGPGNAQIKAYSRG
jgi:hypothetical protein